MIPSSPRFCAPRGTSLGLANAAQKNPMTISMQIRASSIGLVKLKLPMVKNGVKMNEGPGYPGAG